MGMLLKWQVQKINFPVLKHEMDMVLSIEEWEHLNFHVLFLLRQAPI